MEMKMIKQTGGIESDDRVRGRKEKCRIYNARIYNV